jgi:hypothetical protein
MPLASLEARSTVGARVAAVHLRGWPGGQVSEQRLVSHEGEVHGNRTQFQVRIRLHQVLCLVLVARFGIATPSIAIPVNQVDYGMAVDESRGTFSRNGDARVGLERAIDHQSVGQ